MPPLRDPGASPEAERPEYAGQYRLEAQLGSGGMGVVHVARSSSGLLLAVKVIHAEFAQDPEFRGRFRQEVMAARRVSGAFTAPVVDADPDAGRPWMATLYIPGPTLSDQVKRNGPMPPAEVRRLASGLAEALRDIHRAGVVHRDLKPGNVLLAADGPKVIDFGISRPSDSEMRTETGKLIGTPPFMAPEQFQRPREVGPAADVFALGSVLVHAATGSGPFDSESPYLVAYQVVHDEADLSGVPEELAPLIGSCLAKDPSDRPTPGELMELLRTDAMPPAAPTPGTDTTPGTDATFGTDATPGTGATPGTDAMPGADAMPDVRIPAQRQPTDGHPHAEPDAPAPAPVSAPAPAQKTHRGHGHDHGHDRGHGRDRGRGHRRPLWAAAAALLVIGAGTFAGVRALSSGGAGSGDDALQTYTARPADDFRPWHAQLVDRPAGHRSEMPFCTAGSDAVYCVQSGVRAARLEARTGRKAWLHTAKAHPTIDTPPTAPVLSGGLLYVWTPDNRRLDALDPSAKGQGATRWSQDLSGYEGGAAVLGDRILLVAGDGTVTALDSTTHKERWRKPFPGVTAATLHPSGDGRTVYAVGADGGTSTPVTAIDPKDGARRWSRQLPGTLTLAGAGSSGTLYFTAAADPRHPFTTTAVVRYDPRTQRTSRLPLSAPLDGPVAATVSGETVYVLAEGGLLQALGERTWDTDTSVSRGSSLVVSGDRLYFSAADGRLLAVDTRSGAVIGQTRPRLSADRHNGYLETLPAPLPDTRHDRIYAAAPDGTIFAADTTAPASW
ncbi:serine/threonine-protein kinase [Streptomyces sp. NPDC001339]|uniref:serine/threonine-protein kinase n=1 Tax=Streptomyces sp. NPDC001339 TaxID=3364563 RepID=UPI00367AE1A6